MAKNTFYGFICISEDHLHMTANERKAFKFMNDNNVTACQIGRSVYHMSNKTASAHIADVKEIIKAHDELLNGFFADENNRRRYISRYLCEKINRENRVKEMELLTQYGETPLICFEGNYFICK